MKADQKEFINVITAHQRIIFKIANIYCREKSDKEDLSQEIILKIWDNFERYDPQYKRSTWIYQVALNVAISYHRKKKTLKKFIVHSNDALIHIPDDQERSTLDDASLQLTTHIRALNAIDKAIITLHLDGYPHQEIAEITGLSKSNVGTKISRIKKHLIAQFKSKES